ncbi:MULTISPECIES: flagellin N-terminal helical domain-containing protein [Vogesella]|jgi:flagellin|uniref:Flagellin n=1 Tax=Vogesella indigofera TaxID=45465 RepID=A0A495BD33_VOGIN|nr:MULTISPECIES: flagellin [Vogesella]KMJ52536.1 Lateral flagellin [Vogesella sp. EB]MCQ4143778.1 flagellin [Vogesella sp. AC12]MDC7689859.1 flagellin [Vogesella indigofera]RKQ58868.1 flagellin [Vogesella indigofera]
MLSLHTNAASLFTKSNLNTSQNSLTTSMTRLGTGYRINSSQDDAAGLQIATRLEAQSRGMTVAMKNAQNGISLLQTADGALSEVSNIMLRMKDLATEASTATATAADKTAMKAEFDALGAEITNIMTNTKFGGEALLTGGKLAAAMKFQVGATAAEAYTFNASADLTAIGTANTALIAGDLSIADPSAVIALADTAVAAVGTLRSSIGAGANRLNHISNNLANVNNNTQIAKSRIMDTDYANETANMTSRQMLMQAGTSMLKQSGSIGQLAMSLMQ